jgi:hypothetical protein
MDTPPNQYLLEMVRKRGGLEKLLKQMSVAGKRTLTTTG